MLTIQGHHLAYFDDAAFQFADFLRQIMGLPGKNGPLPVGPFFLAGKYVACGLGSQHGACHKAGFCHTEASLKSAGFNSFERVFRFF